MFVHSPSLCTHVPQPLQLLLCREGAGLYWGNMFPSCSAGTSIHVGATGLSRELSQQMVPLSRQNCSRARILHLTPGSQGWLLRGLASQGLKLVLLLPALPLKIHFCHNCTSTPYLLP